MWLDQLWWEIKKDVRPSMMISGSTVLDTRTVSPEFVVWWQVIVLGCEDPKHPAGPCMPSGLPVHEAKRVIGHWLCGSQGFENWLEDTKQKVFVSLRRGEIIPLDAEHSATPIGK